MTEHQSIRAAAPAHSPVMLDEVIEQLAIKPAGRYLDATFGRGGHAQKVLAQLGEQGELWLTDRDPSAILHAHQHFKGDARCKIFHCAFSELAGLAEQQPQPFGFDGMLIDLGVSSPQLDEAERGFSFRRDGPLDMRMDSSKGISAAEWLATVTESELAQVLRQFGEQRRYRRIASKLVGAREHAPLTSTLQLADLVSACIPKRFQKPHIHPATQVFQAIRMQVNDELGELAAFLQWSLTALNPGGRLCVISFHSLEDRQVKRFMRTHASEPEPLRGMPNVPDSAKPPLRLIGNKIKPSAAEVERNPRSRSARLRVAERTNTPVHS